MGGLLCPKPSVAGFLHLSAFSVTTARGELVNFYPMEGLQHYAKDVGISAVRSKLSETSGAKCDSEFRLLRILER